MARGCIVNKRVSAVRSNLNFSAEVATAIQWETERSRSVLRPVLLKCPGPDAKRGRGLKDLDTCNAIERKVYAGSDEKKCQKEEKWRHEWYVCTVLVISGRILAS
jgi:hypothetical protein